jgi:hypothetical protein
LWRRLTLPCGLTHQKHTRRRYKYAFCIIWEPALKPTIQIRATGLGVANAWSKIASIVTPFVRRTASICCSELLMMKMLQISASILSVSVTVPVLIFSGFALIGSILAFMLPFDTKGRAMRDNAASSEVRLEDTQRELLEPDSTVIEDGREPKS